MDTILTHADIGFLAAHYWDRPNYPSSTAIEAPGFKVFKTIQRYLSGRLVDVHEEIDFRLYTTVDNATGRICIWALNMAESRDKTIRLQVQGASGSLIFQHRLAMISDNTSLTSVNLKNDSYEKIVWSVTDLTGTVDPADVTLTFPRAAATMLRIEPHFLTMPDGSYVTLPNLAATAVRSSEGCLYVEQDNRAWGIRVASTLTGIAVGERVEVTGKLGVVRPDGQTASERCITAESVRKVGTGTPLKPLATNCRSVGGGPRGGAAGVRGGFGLSSIGLLVRIARAVREVVDGQSFYLDDGTLVSDVDGKTGVLVRCLSTQELSQDDVVIVTGVVEGNIPDGWDENRRCIRTRFVSDAVRVAP